MYVTLEPCAMCAGALVNSRVERLVYGAPDPKAGYCGTLGNLVQDPRLNHRLEGTAGVLRDRWACLTRKTHAFAKDARTWDAAVSLALFEHNWLRPHPALRVPSGDGRRRYVQRTPAMALGLADHCWTWTEFLTMHVPITT